MVTLANISWGTFGGYEGPAHYGHNFYTPPENASFNDKCFAVTAAAEGSLSSVNMYDRAIISCGGIQWAELIDNKVSVLIGFVAERCGADLVLQHMRPALDLTGAMFAKNSLGQFRFFLGGNEVKGEQLARQLFAGGSGKVGTWTDANRLRAKTWCMCVANLFQDPGACQAQVDFTAPKLRSFVFKNGEMLLFGPGTPEDGYGGAVKALLVGYAINLPATADKTLVAAVAASKYSKWSREWCLDVMHGMAFGSGVSIWPGRYDAKRGPLERLFGVSLPKNSAELAKKAWQTTPVSDVSAPEPAAPNEQPRPVSDPLQFPTSDFAVVRAERDDVPVQSPFLMLLQWLPMLFGFFGQAASWLFHLLRGK